MTFVDPEASRLDVCDCAPLEFALIADVLHLHDGCISSPTRMMSISSEQLDLALFALTDQLALVMEAFI